MSVNLISTMNVVVTAGSKTAPRPLRIVTYTAGPLAGHLCVSWKGDARPVTVTGSNAVMFDPTTAARVPLEATRVCKATDLPGLVSSRVIDAAKTAARDERTVAARTVAERTVDERIAALTKGVKLLTAKAAKNPGDDKTARALATSQARLAQLQTVATPAAPPAKGPVLTPDTLANMIADSGVDMVALIGALSKRL